MRPELSAYLHLERAVLQLDRTPTHELADRTRALMRAVWTTLLSQPERDHLTARTVLRKTPVTIEGPWDEHTPPGITIPPRGGRGRDE